MDDLCSGASQGIFHMKADSDWGELTKEIQPCMHI